MEWKQPYFLWNDRQSFERGEGKNIRITPQGITLREKEASGTYYTRICDSRRPEMEWDYLLLKGQVPYADAVHIAVFSSDDPEALTDEELESPIAVCKQAELTFRENQLLYGVKGRYIRLRIDLEQRDDKMPILQRIQLYFPRQSWTQFLPELYQNRDQQFLERFLRIFQTMYEDMDRKIREAPMLYYADTAPAKSLVWLSQWLSIENPFLWKEKQLRYLIQHGAELSGLRGTKEYLKRMLFLYTGSNPYIVEYWQWAYEDMDSRRRTILEQLYGKDSFCITVIFEHQVLSGQEQMEELERLLELCTPAHIEVQLVILQSRIFLDQHSYLGINSSLDAWSVPVLNGQNFLPFVVGKEEERHYEG